MSVCSPGHKSLCTPPVIRAESSLIKGQHTERSSLGGVRRQILVYCSSSSSRRHVFSSVQATAGVRERVRQIESELGAQQWMEKLSSGIPKVSRM